MLALVFFVALLNSQKIDDSLAVEHRINHPEDLSGDLPLHSRAA
jgi:hypothetical protein